MMTLDEIEALRCTSCDGRGYNMRPLECNFPKPSVTMFKVICGVCNGTGQKPEAIVLRTASEIEGARRKAKGYPPIKRDGSHGE